MRSSGDAQPRRPEPLRFLLCLLALLPVLVRVDPALGQAPSALSVIPPGDRTVMPGSFLTAGFGVVNRTEREQTCVLRVDLPSGWSLLSPPRPVRLPPGGSAKLLLTVSVPGEASATAPYEIGLAATAEGEPAATDTAAFRVSIQRRYALRLQEQQTHQAAAQGKSANFLFRVVNTGNGPDRFRFRATPAVDWPVTVSPQEIELGPGAEGPVRMTVHVPVDASPDTQNPVVLEGVSLGAGPDPGAAAASCRVWVRSLPRAAPRMGSIYQQAPAETELWVTQEKDVDFPSVRSRFQTGFDEELYWMNMRYDGRFLENGETQVTPQDQFLEVNAGGEGWMVNLGDIYGDFTDLTFLSIPGKGGMGTLWNRNLRGRLMGSWWDYGDLQTVAAAASVGAQYQDRYILTLTSIYLDETAQTREARPMEAESLLLSALGTWRPYTWLGVSAEYVESLAELEGVKEPDRAWQFLTLIDRAPDLYVDARYYRAGTYYTGRFRDEEGARLYGIWRVTRPFTLWTNARYYWDNVNGNPLVPRVYTGDYQLGTTLNLPRGWWGQSYLQYSNRQSGWGTQNGEEKILSVTVARSLAHFFCSYRGQGAESQDFTFGNRFYATSNHAVLQTMFGGWTARLAGDFDYAKSSGLEQENMDWRVEGEVIYEVFRGRFLADLRCAHEERQRFGSYGSFVQRFQDIFLRLVYWPSRQMEFRLETYIRNLDLSVGTADWSVSLIWDWRFLVPIPWEKRRAVAQGRVFLDSVGTGRDGPGVAGIPDVPLQLGSLRSLSDQAGAFRFPAVDPGSYPFSVDPSVLPSGLMVGAEVPQDVTLEKGDLRWIDVPVFQEAEVEGRVFEDRDRDGRPGESEEGVSLVRVTVESSAGQVREAFTDRQGRFRMRGLAPGTYELEVDEDYLPAGVAFTAGGEREIMLRPGEILAGQDFAVRPKERPIIKTFGP